ncbi:MULTISPECIES: M1 family metallopeptidase [Rhodanobacter]|uniref:M1 family metallopeptidase n=1 Tax=Rhodanobacter TaxID=75309 RepID=UPI00041ECB64|nr:MULTISPECIES: M1 family metallopeptidase [Rhodanobacter]KZC20503.1 aminopeptidase [Rhodanobacter denitrificans]UJJ50726.1 M1 family metallopeptidase [Rhodanobacter denitrificans]UJM93440.1 M1 family metallopeptidase [Rhodanobacter denitrificans]UJM96972.1 M1 family metallopeptidase [Rhodanobacter denitrificans]UJN20201.1 M1 family metallopeptidase [Rhodanobacter denitrificans]
MRLLSILALGSLVLPLAAYANDPNSYAQPDQVRVTHLDLDLTIDFPHKQLDGQATLKLDWKNPKAQSLVLDTRDLKIARVEALAADGKATPLKYALAPRDKVLGSKLTIATPKHPAQVRIVYTSSPEASGLQWLTPAQTADKKLPFMFSQSESIHARSWVPLQDSPAIRFTYDARVTAPKDVRVVMSAINDAKHPLDGKFAFEQPHPIPSYLLAIAAGDLAVKETGPRSAVYAEPSVVNKAAHEFEDTEQLIAATEQLYGPYAWGRYDILVLPPSFPFGGMENPNMTFATPTVLVGDKSLVSLVSHELAHSWSGNLVTSAAWRDIWLNEGFTTYVQGRITEAVYGKALADEEALLSARALQKSIGAMAANAQKLAPDPRGIGADDALSDVAYDKGSWFLRTLEQRFGREAFDAYLKGYFQHFAFQSISTEQMLDYLKPNLIEKYPGKMGWDEAKAWVYGEGIPKDAPLPDSPRFNAIDRERTDFLAGSLAADKLDAKGWNTQEWMYFLDRLPDAPPLPKMQELDAAWHLTGTPNAEIGMRWYSHAIAAGDKAVWNAAAEHMTRIGRIYLTTPLYKALVKTPEGLAFAEQVYARAKAGYHPLTQQVVEGILAKAKQAKH